MENLRCKQEQRNEAKKRTTSAPVGGAVAAPAIGVGVAVDRFCGGINELDVVLEFFVMALHFLHRLPADGPGHILPAVGGVVVACDGYLEPLVLLFRPRLLQLAGGAL